jgi:hypothetical protein
MTIAANSDRITDQAEERAAGGAPGERMGPC